MNMQSEFTAFREGYESTLRKSLDRPWVGRLLHICLGLALLFLVLTLILFLVTIYGVAKHGAGELSGGIDIARWWLIGMLTAVFLVLLRFWWLFGRDARLDSGHPDLKAAQAGDAAAAHRVAQRYVGKDALSARSWLVQAARSGHPEAMVDFALMLRAGDGGVRDLPGARAWLARAAEVGHPEAAGLLAEVEAQLADRHQEGDV